MKQTTNIFRDFKVSRKIRLMFSRPKGSMKGKCYVCSGYKQRNNVCLLYLECKMRQERYRWCIFKLKRQKTLKRTNLENAKQQTRYRWGFSMLNCLRKGNNCIFVPIQQTRKVQLMHLALNLLKIKSKKSQQWSES